jgi:hypothetical protein
LFSDSAGLLWSAVISTEPNKGLHGVTGARHAMHATATTSAEEQDAAACIVTLQEFCGWRRLDHPASPQQQRSPGSSAAA